MTDSRLVGTSSSTRTLDERDLSVMRPAAAPKPRRPRKSADPALRQVTNGIVCFCGERFGEHQALEFMLHLRAEVGDDLAARRRYLRQKRESDQRRREDPESLKRILESKRKSDRRRGADPEFRAKKASAQRARYVLARELHDDGDHSRCNPSRCLAVADPEQRQRRLEAQREYNHRRRNEAVRADA